MANASFTLAAVLGAAVLAPGMASADIVSSSPSHYELSLQMRSSLSPEEMWARLIQPAEWWSPNHTYSGDAANLSLDPRAGGLWREDWTGGSVTHGDVLLVIEGEQLRLNAPFGPLQGMGVNVVWTITVGEGPAGGSVVTFDEVATGGPASRLDEIAPAVDAVKAEALQRLTLYEAPAPQAD